MRACISIALSLICALAAASPEAQAEPRTLAGNDSAHAGAAAIGAPELDAAFHLLYELKFSEARAGLKTWQAAHLEDPLGPAAEAASYLFEEFYAQGVLTTEFFLDDKRLLGGIQGKPDPTRGDAFKAANRRAQELAKARLKVNPQDAGALFAMTLSTGMQADYASIIEKHQLESLRAMRSAEDYAHRLLAVAPDAADAYLALGAANYIIGCLPAHTRFFIWFGGFHGDKGGGMKQLAETAEHGRFLRPFAKLMLALAELREKQVASARERLRQLAAEFPENALFRRELAKINSRSTGPLRRASAP
jgi:hypothetical protein